VTGNVRFSGHIAISGRRGPQTPVNAVDATMRKYGGQSVMNLLMDLDG